MVVSAAERSAIGPEPLNDASCSHTCRSRYRPGSAQLGGLRTFAEMGRAGKVASMLPVQEAAIQAYGVSLDLDGRKNETMYRDVKAGFADCSAM
jgi:hypothetical protein